MRLNMRISGSAETLITKLSESLGVSPKEMILDAVALYEVAVSELQQGGRLGIKDKDGNFMAIGTATLRASQLEELKTAAAVSSHEKQDENNAKLTANL